MSITGQVGHIALARQTVQGTPNTTAGQLVPVKITGDSLVANTNPLIAEGEIGMGRDVSDAIPGGFQSAGAINGNLRVRPAALFLEAALGQKNAAGSFSTPVGSGGSSDSFQPADMLNWWTVEKKVGAATPQQLVIQYSDAMVNTLSISAPAGALATFSAGLITTFEARTDRTNASKGAGDNSIATESYPSSYDDLLVFHGGRIYLGDSPTGQGSPAIATQDNTWQSVEIALNNNIAADEYTVRPSRFLRSLTMGIRQLDTNFTLVFENPDKYSRFAYGSQSVNSPGYSFYLGSLQVFLGNYQLLVPTLDAVGSTVPYVGASNALSFTPATPGSNVYGTATPAAPGNGAQSLQLNIPKLAFTGFPVALASGRIAVTTSARALKDPNAPIITAWVTPGGAGTQY